jgi:eukaryotic-like serine/threonine-protein kinase
MVELDRGVKITSNIQLSEKMGEGGMGSVWAADHLTLETQVAVKFISDRQITNPNARLRFSREASAAARIKSPHVVQVFDHGVCDGTPYIVMELLAGEDLHERMVKEPRLSMKLFLPILQQVCKGIAKAHEVQIIHRDLKPANVFLSDNDGEVFVKLLDFGLAKATTTNPNASTKFGAMLGTPFFMSPEQITSAKDVDLQADLWAIATIAYFCLTGDFPFVGETVGAVNIATVARNYMPISQRELGLPSGLDAWFERAFHRDITQRFQSARELMDEFMALAPLSVQSLIPKPNDAEFPRVSNWPTVAAPAEDDAPGKSVTVNTSPRGAVTLSRTHLVASGVAVIALTGIAFFLGTRVRARDTSGMDQPSAIATQRPLDSVSEPRHVVPANSAPSASVVPAVATSASVSAAPSVKHPNTAPSTMKRGF